MRVLIDANVLYPTVLREIILGVAETGAFTPLWSHRILEEWARAARRNGGQRDEAIARGEIALCRARWPEASVNVAPDTEARLHLPDPADCHVLAAAIDGGAQAILTLNTRDFPIRALGAEDILRRHPDEFLLEAWHADPPRVGAVVSAAYGRYRDRTGDDPGQRKLLKKARLPRLGKALDQATP